MTTFHLRRALIAVGAGVAAVTGAGLATTLVPPPPAHRVVVERQAASTERAATDGTYELTRRG
ncbi:MAG: hypothetical protein QOC59_269, partial [Microbacteriaceae bacterium]|nr:hypothetical protein [Microbacteriaceae bacterium]